MYNIDCISKNIRSNTIELLYYRYSYRYSFVTQGLPSYDSYDQKLKF